MALGKTGTGKSSLTNTIFGETVFGVNHLAKSGTVQCEAKTKSVNGRSIMWVDTPGVFDTRRSDEEIKEEILKSIEVCAPGPHVFIIVLRMKKYTKQEEDGIHKLKQNFSEEAFKYATVLFTHGDQLPVGETVQKYIEQKQKSE